MSAVFTLHAVERMRDRGVTDRDRAHLLHLIERIATAPSELGRSEDAVRVGSRTGKDTYILRAGDIQAVVTVDPAKPEQVIVMTVYRADEINKHRSRLEWNDVAQKAG